MITIRSRTADGRLVIREWQSEAEIRTCWERESASLQTELIQLVVQDGLVLYSGLDPAQLILGGPLWWKDLIHWFSPVVETNAREPDRKELIGARAIRASDFTLSEDAAEWVENHDGDESYWLYRLTPQGNVEKALGTYALASNPGSRINILIMVRAGYDQLSRNLLINFYWDSGKMERCVRALSPEEQRVLLAMVQDYEVARLTRSLRSNMTGGDEQNEFHHCTGDPQPLGKE